MTIERIVFLDFEYRQDDGCRPTPHCLVWRQWGCGEVHHVWLADGPVESPWPDTDGILFVAYNVVAEASCFLALGWPEMQHALDLYVEFKARTNDTLFRYRLLECLSYFGVDSIDHSTKEHWRQVAMAGGPFGAEQRTGLLAYCQTDVDALVALYPKMYDRIDWRRALHRGRYQLAVARMEHDGVPMDAATYGRIQSEWERIKLELIDQVDPAYGVFEQGVFKQERFAQYVLRRGFEWDLTEGSEQLRTDDDYFRGQARRYSELEPLRQLTGLLSTFKRMSIGRGPDDRNRGPLMSFGTKTGRNAPRARLSLFSGSRWIRGLIMPDEGRALVYADWSAQEFGILGALSQDEAMLEGYRAGTPYLHLAYRAGAVPLGTPRAQCEAVRNLYKIACLAQQYGQGPYGLRDTLGCTTAEAKRLLRDHKRVFHGLHDWLDKMTDDAMIRLRCIALHGWQMRLHDETSHRTVANFFAQANGAELLRLAILNLQGAGLQVVMPVHDAVLVECDAANVQEVTTEVERIMGDASEELLLGRLRLQTSTKTYQPGERILDDGGMEMWHRITGMLQA